MLLSRFLRDRKGGVAPLLALSVLPIMGAVAASVDYSRAATTRSAMQSALDATGLMLSKSAQELNDTALNQKANEYFKAVFNQPQANNVSVTAQLAQPTQGSYKLTLNGTASVDTMFTQIIGQSTLDFSANSEVVWGIKKLEIALALDNTGSMANGGKMVELKKAVHNLLDTLEKAAGNPDDVRVAIVPFDTTVRLDQNHNSAASWVEFDGKQEKNTWIGCVEDRDQSNDVTDTPPNGSSATAFPAKKCANNGALVRMRPLTNDWKALRLTVNGMNPNGNTNTTIGLVWAWHALTPELPFTEARPAEPDRDKVIILMTDGENTQNRWTTSRNAIDARTQKACDNIKAANIRIYTVRVIAGNEALLKNCATKPNMYYNVEEAVQLDAAFGAIAQNLANLRIAK